MGTMYVTLNQGTDNEVTITATQHQRLKELGERLGESEWHVNECGCCVAIHPKGQHDRGYVIDQDGGYEWVGPGEPEARG